VPPSPVDRPPITSIVAVPGLGLSAAVPRCTLDRLPAPSAVVELPGYGLPASRRTDLGPDDLARLLLTRLDESGVAPAVLLGHSASCQIVVQAAVRDPDRVTALVLVGPTTDPRARSWLGLAGRWLHTALWERPGQAPRLVRDYRRTGLVAMGRGMNAARRDRIDRGLAQVRCPVLVVRGCHDRIAPQDWTEALAAAAPHGQTWTLPLGAHMVPLTHPEELATGVRTFLGAAAGAITAVTAEPRDRASGRS
jgi:pimeloyl-ACP methyl ester carboxylesterase